MDKIFYFQNNKTSKKLKHYIWIKIHQWMTSFASKFLRMHLIDLMVMTHRTEAHTTHAVAYSVISYKKKAYSQPVKIPRVHSENKKNWHRKFGKPTALQGRERYKECFFWLSESINRDNFWIFIDNAFCFCNLYLYPVLPFLLFNSTICFTSH